MFEERDHQPPSTSHGKVLLNTANLPSGLSADFSPTAVGNGVREAISRVSAAASKKGGSEVHLQHPDHKRAISLGVAWVKSLVTKTCPTGGALRCTPLVAHGFPDGSRELLISIDRGFFWHTVRPLLRGGVRTLEVTRHANPAFFLLEIVGGEKSGVTFSQVLSSEEFRSMQSEFRAIEKVFSDYGQKSYPMESMNELSWVSAFVSEATLSAIEEARKQRLLGDATAMFLNSLLVKSESPRSLDVSFVVSGPNMAENSERASFEMSVNFRINHRTSGELQSLLTLVKV